MNEWEMVLALVVLIGLIATVVKPMITLTKSITELTGAMREMKEDLTGLMVKNTESHRHLWMKNEEQDGRLDDHEIRIRLVEEKKGEEKHEN